MVEVSFVFSVFGVISLSVDDCSTSGGWEASTTTFHDDFSEGLRPENFNVLVQKGYTTTQHVLFVSPSPLLTSNLVTAQLQPCQR